MVDLNGFHVGIIYHTLNPMEYITSWYAPNNKNLPILEAGSSTTLVAVEGRSRTTGWRSQVPQILLDVLFLGYEIYSTLGATKPMEQ